MWSDERNVGCRGDGALDGGKASPLKGVSYKDRHKGTCGGGYQRSSSGSADRSRQSGSRGDWPLF